MKQLIQAVETLIADIEVMQIYQDPNWFGPFSEHEQDDYEIPDVSIEWPNLAITLSQVKEALDKAYEENKENAQQLT